MFYTTVHCSAISKEKNKKNIKLRQLRLRLQRQQRQIHQYQAHLQINHQHCQKRHRVDQDIDSNITILQVILLAQLRTLLLDLEVAAIAAVAR